MLIPWLIGSAATLSSMQVVSEFLSFVEEIP